MNDKIGHYAILVAGQPPGWDTTALGIAMYDGDSNLIHSRFEPLEKAIRRGDLPDNIDIKVPHHLPQTWEEMEKTFERTGNAMSIIRWYEGGATMKPDIEHANMLYKSICGHKE